MEINIQTCGGVHSGRIMRPEKRHLNCTYNVLQQSFIAKYHCYCRRCKIYCGTFSRKSMRQQMMLQLKIGFPLVSFARYFRIHFFCCIDFRHICTYYDYFLLLLTSLFVAGNPSITFLVHYSCDIVIAACTLTIPTLYRREVNQRHKGEFIAHFYRCWEKKLRWAWIVAPKCG